MSLNDIQLGSFLVQQMYKKTLIDVGNVKDIPASSSPESISVLGKNEKSILIIINEKDTAFLDDKDLNLLIGILSACKLSMADIALINFHQNQQLRYAQVIEKFSPKLILLFGTTPAQLEFPLNFPDFQLQQYNHQAYLSSPALKVLAADKEQKKELWLCLQRHFFKT
jgi:DNA polymerase III psi subunit